MPALVANTTIVTVTVPPVGSVTLPDTPVACAYLELSTPDLPTVVNQLVVSGVTAVSIVPMFLGVGRHAREDLPELVTALRLTFPNLALTLNPAVGENAKLVQLLADIALEGL